MCETIIKEYSTSVMCDFIKRAKEIKKLNHSLFKGELKELFVSDVLRSFLPSQFDIGSGIIVNGVSEQSRQTDIVIYGNRILPPFIKKQNLGVFPVHSVIATLEIKTSLVADELKDANDAAKTLIEGLSGGPYVYYKEGGIPYGLSPLCAIFSFEGGFAELSERNKGIAWLNENIEHLWLICVAEKYCWAKVGGKGWTNETHTETYNEVKRFIALLVDNIRFHAQERFKYLVEQQHFDWLSMYIR
jgi:hypothetical protein